MFHVFFPRKFRPETWTYFSLKWKYDIFQDEIRYYLFLFPLHDFCRKKMFIVQFFLKFHKMCLDFSWKSILRLEPASKDPQKNAFGAPSIYVIYTAPHLYLDL